MLTSASRAPQQICQSSLDSASGDWTPSTDQWPPYNTAAGVAVFCGLVDIYICESEHLPHVRQQFFRGRMCTGRTVEGPVSSLEERRSLFPHATGCWTGCGATSLGGLTLTDRDVPSLGDASRRLGTSLPDSVKSPSEVTPQPVQHPVACGERPRQPL